VNTLERAYYKRRRKAFSRRFVEEIVEALTKDPLMPDGWGREFTITVFDDRMQVFGVDRPWDIPLSKHKGKRKIAANFVRPVNEVHDLMELMRTVSILLANQHDEELEPGSDEWWDRMVRVRKLSFDDCQARLERQKREQS